MVASNLLTRKVQKLEDARMFLEDIALRKVLLDALTRQRYRTEMELAGGVTDQEILDRLVDADFCADTLPALLIAPIAVVAWASGDLSPEEATESERAIDELGLTLNPLARGRFREWLTNCPDRGLLDLWAETTRYRMASWEPSARDSFLFRLHHQATRVALASGGLLGFGRVCDAEREVLDFILHQAEASPNEAQPERNS